MELPKFPPHWLIGRRPKESPLCQCLCAHFDDFVQAYPEKYEKILRHLKLWPERPAPACLSRAPPPTGVDRVIEPFFDDPFPDYDTEPVMAYANDPDFAA